MYSVTRTAVAIAFEGTLELEMACNTTAELYDRVIRCAEAAHAVINVIADQHVEGKDVEVWDALNWDEVCYRLSMGLTNTDRSPEAVASDIIHLGWNRYIAREAQAEYDRRMGC